MKPFFNAFYEHVQESTSVFEGIAVCVVFQETVHSAVCLIAGK